MPDKELLKEYALICAKEKQIVGKKAELKAMIEDQLPQEPAKIKTPYGKFTLVEKPKFIYSPAVRKLQEDLNKLKIEEEEQTTYALSEGRKGPAEMTLNYFLRFKAD